MLSSMRLYMQKTRELREMSELPESHASGEVMDTFVQDASSVYSVAPRMSISGRHGSRRWVTSLHSACTQINSSLHVLHMPVLLCQCSLVCGNANACPATPKKYVHALVCTLHVMHETDFQWQYCWLPQQCVHAFICSKSSHI